MWLTKCLYKFQSVLQNVVYKSLNIPLHLNKYDDNGHFINFFGNSEYCGI